MHQAKSNEQLHIWEPIGSVVAGLIAFSSVLAWFYNEIALMSINSDEWVTMKFSTALCITLLSVSRHARYHGGSSSAIAGCIISLAIITLSISDINLGFEKEDTIKTVAPNVPSIGTFICLTCLSIRGIFPDKTSIMKWIPILMSTLAIIGYMTSSPSLYYWWPEVSTAMALTTAICLLLISID